jgi:hypothetical protein
MSGGAGTTTTSSSDGDDERMDIRALNARASIFYCAVYTVMETKNGISLVLFANSPPERAVFGREVDSLGTWTLHTRDNIGEIFKGLDAFLVMAEKTTDRTTNIKSLETQFDTAVIDVARTFSMDKEADYAAIEYTKFVVMPRLLEIKSCLDELLGRYNGAPAPPEDASRRLAFASVAAANAFMTRDMLLLFVTEHGTLATADTHKLIIELRRLHTHASALNRAHDDFGTLPDSILASLDAHATWGTDPESRPEISRKERNIISTYFVHYLKMNRTIVGDYAGMEDWGVGDLTVPHPRPTSHCPASPPASPPAGHV